LINGQMNWTVSKKYKWSINTFKNVNQNDTGIPFHPSQNGNHEENK
jgi:hypothetical protein